MSINPTHLATHMGADLHMHGTRGDTAAKALTNNRLIYEQMRADILSGRLLPGQKMNIAALAQDAGVSAGAVREALAMLEADALVVSEPQRGYRVSPVSAEDLIQLTAARIEVEKLCLTEAIKHGDFAWENKFVAAYHQLRHVQERDARDKQHLSAEWTAAHANFHHTLVAGCPNVWLIRLHATLYSQSERYRQLSVVPIAKPKRNTLKEHQQLYEAVLGRDVATAHLLIEKHLHTTSALLLASPMLGSAIEG